MGTRFPYGSRGQSEAVYASAGQPPVSMVPDARAVWWGWEGVNKRRQECE